jgi:hypothetical protein
MAGKVLEKRGNALEKPDRRTFAPAGRISLHTLTLPKP